MKKYLFALLIIHPFISFPQAPTNGLVAYYPFNGNINDEGLNQLNGISVGLNPISYGPDRFGIENKAAFLDRNSRISIFNSQNIGALLTDNFSISFWFKSEDTHNLSTTGYYEFVQLISSQYFQIGFELRPWTSFFYLGTLGMQGREAYISEIEANKWYFICFVVNRPTVLRYSINDKNNFTPNGTSDILNLTNLNSIIINNKFTFETESRFRGSMDELRIYNRTLTESEISILRGSYFDQSSVYFLENQNSINKGTPLKVNFKAISH